VSSSIVSVKDFKKVGLDVQWWFSYDPGCMCSVRGGKFENVVLVSSIYTFRVHILLVDYVIENIVDIYKKCDVRLGRFCSY
jgi:hypothetical protein